MLNLTHDRHVVLAAFAAAMKHDPTPTIVWRGPYTPLQVTFEVMVTVGVVEPTEGFAVFRFHKDGTVEHYDLIPEQDALGWLFDPTVSSY